jgi:hypothetical protein
VGADHVLFVHDGSAAGHDLFVALLTSLDPEVHLTVARGTPAAAGSNGTTECDRILEDQTRAEQLKRELDVLPLDGPWGPAIVEAARAGNHDLIILPLDRESSTAADAIREPWIEFVLNHAGCFVLLAVPPPIPALTEDE